MIIAVIAACTALMANLASQLNGAADATIDSVADIMFL